MKYWEMIADEIHKAGWTYGYTQTVNMETGEKIWVVDAHKDDGHRYVVHAGDLLCAFMELQNQIVGMKKSE